MSWKEFIPFHEFFAEEEKVLDEKKSFPFAGNDARTSNHGNFYDKNDLDKVLQLQKINLTRYLQLFLATFCILFIFFMVRIIYRNGMSILASLSALLQRPFKGDVKKMDKMEKRLNLIERIITKEINLSKKKMIKILTKEEEKMGEEHKCFLHSYESHLCAFLFTVNKFEQIMIGIGKHVKKEAVALVQGDDSRLQNKA